MTLRAHVPVATPAGLIFALPPVWCLHDKSSPTVHGEGCPWSHKPGDVFALAVPCPTSNCSICGRFITQERRGEAWIDESGWLTCRNAGFHLPDSPWVRHGDYRVLEVRRVEMSEAGVPMMVERNGKGHGVSQYPLPGAVPGGVALIVEQVDG